MVQHLVTCTEVAVDLEHHHYRSFQGFTCLLQISSRTEDFVVDPLALRSHLGAALTPIFANPKASSKKNVIQAEATGLLRAACCCQCNDKWQ